MSKSKRGFASMPKWRLIDIARQGGKAVHKAGTGHEFTHEEAKIAGKKGGDASAEARRKKEFIGME